MNNEPVLTVCDLWVEFGRVPVLEGINLTVLDGEMMSLVGPNGGGKTSLLKTILGLVVPARGEVRVLGCDPRLVPLKGLVGYLPQRSNPDLLFPLRARDVVAMSRYARQKFRERLVPADRRSIEDALAAVGMLEWQNDLFSSLSGGQRQRVLIARALALEPKILILDEPSTGLDAVAQDAFYELLVRLKKERSLSVIMVSHDIGAVSAFSDRIACLNRIIHFHGRPAECLTPESLAKVFGKNVQFLLHDRECDTCRSDR